MIYQQGHPFFSLFYVVSGIVKITNENKHGKVTVQRLVRKGGLLDISAIPEKKIHNNSASALTGVDGFFIPIEEFEFTFRKVPKWTRDIILNLIHERDSAENKLVTFHNTNVRERVAYLLLLEKEIFGKEENGTWNVDQCLTRKEESSMIAITNESLIRCLKEFKEVGLIKQHGKRITLENLAGLKTLARLAN